MMRAEPAVAPAAAAPDRLGSERRGNDGTSRAGRSSSASAFDAAVAEAITETRDRDDAENGAADAVARQARDDAAPGALVPAWLAQVLGGGGGQAGGERRGSSQDAASSAAVKRCQGEATAPVTDDAEVTLEALASTPGRVLQQEAHFRPVRNRSDAVQHPAAEEREFVAARARGRPAAEVVAPGTDASTIDAQPGVHAAASPGNDREPDVGAISPAAQVLDALAARDAEADVERPADLRAAQSIESRDGPSPSVRMIRIALTPASLGTVHVVVAGSEGALRIRLEAERPETAKSLEQDRAAIVQRLAASGEVLEELMIARLAAPEVVPAASPDRNAPASQQNDPRNASANSHAHHSRDDKGEAWVRPDLHPEAAMDASPDRLRVQPVQGRGARVLGRRTLGSL